MIVEKLIIQCNELELVKLRNFAKTHVVNDSCAQLNIKKIANDIFNVKIYYDSLYGAVYSSVVHDLINDLLN